MIKLENVTKKYGSVLALDNISFEINEGEIVGLLGPNGAGKSTTMNIITGFIEQTSGKVTIDGYDTVKKSQKAKKQIGYMPEGVPLYGDLTVREFITYMAELKGVKRKDKKEKVQKALEDAGLENVQNRLTKNLSRGYKQRVSLAGTLVSDPKVIILDEPTVGLDPKQVTEIREVIKRLGKEHTVILSSHILSEVSQICNRVIIINKGKIVAIDTPKNLESKVSSKNIIYITVEDNDNKIETIRNKINGIKEIRLIKENEDKTRQYSIEAESNTDLRKSIFENLAKENITIFEMKKADTSLEDAFMRLIEKTTSTDSVNNVEKQVEKIQIEENKGGEK
ncbi:MAG: ABC transporter ATP-binding protein [Clostridia bacterium]|nr:ABC transporter ATP-binding protein [Clostridia bacterium]